MEVHSLTDNIKSKHISTGVAHEKKKKSRWIRENSLNLSRVALKAIALAYTIRKYREKDAVVYIFHNCESIKQGKWNDE